MNFFEPSGNGRGIDISSSTSRDAEDLSTLISRKNRDQGDHFGCNWVNFNSLNVNFPLSELLTSRCTHDLFAEKSLPLAYHFAGSVLSLFKRATER